MRSRLLTAIAAFAALGAADATRVIGNGVRSKWSIVPEAPYAPSASAAPFLVAGYREFAADLFWIRTVGYSSGGEDSADGDSALFDAIAALDPHYDEIYKSGAARITIAKYGVNKQSYLDAARLLEQGTRLFPDNWRYPFEAGQIYILDLAFLVKKDDPQQERAYNELGVHWLEHAVRLPGAPASAATLAATMQSKMGRTQQAIDSLRSVILTTDNEDLRRRLYAQLAKLEKQSEGDLRFTLRAERKAFVDKWQRDRPALPATMYLLLGPHANPSVDVNDFAVIRDLIGTTAADDSDLEPTADDPPVPAK